MDKLAMHQSMRSALFFFIIAAGAAAARAIETDTTHAELITDPHSFLGQYCLACHGEEKQKGDRRFDHLGLDSLDDDTAFEWQDILDMINLGEMPPVDEIQPSGDEVGKIVSLITPKLNQYYASQSQDEITGFRRLNSFQYRNTIRDLLGLNMASYDPTRNFPAEDKVHGFNNIGSKLVTSRYLMERYLEAASTSIDKVIDPPSTPPVFKQEYNADDLWTLRIHFRGRAYYIVNIDGKYVEIGHGSKEDYIYPFPLESGVPVDGYYHITVKAAGMGRENPYDPALFNVDLTEPLKLEIFANDTAVDKGRDPNPTNRHIETIALDDNNPREYKVKVWLDKGFNFGFRYANGPLGNKRSVMAVQKEFYPETITANFNDEFADYPSEILDNYLSDVYQGPRVRIYSAGIEGPAADLWPAQNYRDLLRTDTHGRVNADPYVLIRDFASKAFRRPVLLSELDPFNSFYEQEKSDGKSEITALADTYKAILCSPQFLYIETPLDEPLMDGGPNLREMKAYRLASRLSYFLWGSMPDQLLLDSADSGELLEPTETRYQALRMLRDPKAEAFIANFTDGWLDLGKLDQLTPDLVKYKQYAEQDLGKSMREETRSFFRYILSENLNITELLSANYSFVDRNLAKHYGISHAALGEKFEKVEFPADSFRGGLLGAASIQTVSANGVDTSPVVRGVWIMENILGTPPSPAPDDVPALEPDIRGATSIRDQLSKHRTIATCNECHRKMDPLGFAMENFDAIGGFRDYYTNVAGERTVAVDASGQLPTGEAFEDVRGLKRILTGRTEQFARTLTEKLLMYALGREIAFSDRSQVVKIMEELDRRGGGLQDLVEITVTSDAFLAN